MDKEAQEKIAKALYERCAGQLWEEASASSVDYYWSVAHLALTKFEELGYRKLPKDKPPLLSSEEFIAEFKKMEESNAVVNMPWMWGKQVAQAQREGDIKFYTSK